MERDEWTKHAVEQWPWLFGLAGRFTAEAYQLLAGTEIGQRDARGAMRALLFGRIISGTEALVVLARSGFLTEADVIFSLEPRGAIPACSIVRRRSNLPGLPGRGLPQAPKGDA
jgi:hypothetical protein